MCLKYIYIDPSDVMTTVVSFIPSGNSSRMFRYQIKNRRHTKTTWTVEEGGGLAK